MGHSEYLPFPTLSLKAQMDIDFNHTDDGTHEFPHIHVWDRTKKPPRQDEEVKKMHDDCIVAYSVNLEEKNIVVQTYNNTKKKQSKICFSEVLTHSFKCIIDYNIISDIQECEMSTFFSDNQEELIKMEGYCWPVDYQTAQELIDFLRTNEYKYIKINSSYGMFGWILAKSYNVEE